MNAQVRAELARVAAEMGGAGVEFVLERPRDAGHGDLATNLAMALARQLKANPRQLAQEIVSRIALPGSVISRTEIAGPGFINFWLAEDQLAAVVRGVIQGAGGFGRAVWGEGERVNVEFVSANPTGPLHVGHGRGAAIGDVVARLLEWTGHEVTREFYINDAGVQIDRLADSLWARVQQHRGRGGEIPEGGYHGEYLVEAAARAVEDLEGPLFDGPLDAARDTLRKYAITLLRAEQERDLEEFQVRYDVWTSEQALHRGGQVAGALALLHERGLTYEQDGALWLRTSAFGDDKDRVLRKQDGTFTYFVPDIAYHIDKRTRGFDRVIDVWGADHHGYIPRMRSVLVALGYPGDFFEVTLVQLVKVMRGGEEVRMSKRSGEFVTLRDLFEEVGVDAARYFFLMRRSDSQFVFDVDLAKSQTDENPVFYVQMAHARMSGIFRVAGRAPEDVGDHVDVGGLPHADDVAVVKKLAVFPDVVSRAARNREPHLVTGYLEELARLVHGWYHNCRVLGEAPEVERGRLVLARAARTVLANGLNLLGLTAPDRM